MDRYKRSKRPAMLIENTMFIDSKTQIEYNQFITDEKINKRNKKRKIKEKENVFVWPEEH